MYIDVFVKLGNGTFYNHCRDLSLLISLFTFAQPFSITAIQALSSSSLRFIPSSSPRRRFISSIPSNLCSSRCNRSHSSSRDGVDILTSNNKHYFITSQKMSIYSSERFEFCDIIFHVSPNLFHSGHTSLQTVKPTVRTIEYVLHTVEFTLKPINFALCIINPVEFVLQLLYDFHHFCT
ncbi:hypothetical protein ATCV1_z540R [Acanthocystis turfacea chlorella virus 1]|uniref:Uncharacterized protein z540R n=1 Tax=Chlorovirus heliozoae TaxID=322019 RepID=A7K9F0_9PHYC|nr:hypothetical protein ATCV1_z540R [Acanthocystis turfacea chlorella virus 1]ABT16674.1 hypothetical protein ATCV1_z540R [Acanthocystis turfacea chlorella virus 1]